MQKNYLNKIAKKLLLIQKVYLIGLLKKVGQVFETLKTSQEKVETSKKNLEFTKEKTLAVSGLNVMGKFRKYLYLIDQLSFVILAKNRELFY